MDPRKRNELEAAGWTIGSAADFLELTEEEQAYVDLKLDLGELLRARRLEARLSQQALARRMKSSQSRVAKMEYGDPTVSIDLQVKALLELGVTSAELGAAIAESGQVSGWSRAGAEAPPQATVMPPSTT